MSASGGGGGGVSRNSVPFGQAEKGEMGCKNWSFFLDVINVWSLFSSLNFRGVF